MSPVSPPREKIAISVECFSFIQVVQPFVCIKDARLLCYATEQQGQSHLVLWKLDIRLLSKCIGDHLSVMV